eukprot:10443933-Alexandrium_andersonii.AAC.1
MDLIVPHGGVERFGRGSACAGDALLQFARVMQSEGPAVSEDGQRVMMDCCRRRLLGCGLAGVVPEDLLGVALESCDLCGLVLGQGGVNETGCR